MGGSHSCPCQSPQAKATHHQDGSAKDSQSEGSICPVLDALTHHHPDQSQHSWVSHFERHQDEVQEETETRICLFLSCVGIFSLLPNKLEEQRMGGSHNCPCQSPRPRPHT